jgi:hypothetical protein
VTPAGVRRRWFADTLTDEAFLQASM